jgi:hypothetical protein
VHQRNTWPVDLVTEQRENSRQHRERAEHRHRDDQHGADGHRAEDDVAGEEQAAADGDIEADDLRGELSLRVKDGSVRAGGLRTGTVAAQSADGDVRLSFAVAPTSVTGSSKDGSITVQVPRDRTAYDVDVSVKDGSRTVDVPTDPEADRRITLSAADGSLTVASR